MEICVFDFNCESAVIYAEK